MNRLIIPLITLTLFSLSSAHASNYTFRDNTSFTVEEFYRDTSSNYLHNNKAITRTQNVSNTTGVISDLNVTLHGIYSASFAHMNFVLVGPNNTGVILSSSAGGHLNTDYAKLSNTTFTFDDNATNPIPTARTTYEARNLKVNSGSYLPTGGSGNPSSLLLHIDKTYKLHNVHTQILATKYSGIKDSKQFKGVDFAETNRLAAFNDISANGSWRLMAYDCLSYRYASGSRFYGNPTLTTINGGWSLDITTRSGAVPEPAEWMLIGICACGIITLKLKSHILRVKSFH